MNIGISESNQLEILKILSTFLEIQEVILYGSRAKGNWKKGSDIDLTLLGDKIDLDILNHLLLRLDELFLPVKFDISIYRYINNPDLIDHIERVGILFYKKSP